MMIDMRRPLGSADQRRTNRLALAALHPRTSASASRPSSPATVAAAAAAKGAGIATLTAAGVAAAPNGAGKEPTAPSPPPAPPRLDRAGHATGRLLSDYSSGLASQFMEYDYYVDPSWVEGAVPEGLEGTLFTVGPGMTTAYGTTVRNPDDADGMVSSFAFDGAGKIFFRNRFVRTRTFMAEQRAKRRMSRGFHDRGAPMPATPGAGSGPLGLLSSLPGMPTLPALFNPLDLDFRAPANANVMYWGGKLLAMSENALPYELNKLSLDALGETDLSGTGKLASGYKVEARQNAGGRRLVTMGSSQSGPDTLLRWAELDENGTAVAQLSYKVPGCIARGIKDFFLTDEYYVVLQAPLSLNLPRVMARYPLGEVSFAECLDWDDTLPAKLHLIPRALASPGAKAPVNGRQVTVVEAPPLLLLSAVGCYRAGPGGRQLVLDGVLQEGGTGAYKEMLTDPMPGYFKGPPKPELTRLVVDLQSRTCAARVLCQRGAHGVTLGHRRAATAAAPASPLRPPYRNFFMSASANDDAENWGPAQVLVKLTVPPEYAVPPTVRPAEGSSANGAAAAAADMPYSVSALRRRTDVVVSQVWSPGDRVFLGPPTFIPKAHRQPSFDISAGPATSEEAWAMAAVRTSGAAARAAAAQEEDGGWLLTMLHDAETNRSELLIMDAEDITAGPVAVVRLPHFIPHPNAAAFAQAYCGPARGAPGGWKPAGPKAAA